MHSRSIEGRGGGLAMNERMAKNSLSKHSLAAIALFDGSFKKKFEMSVENSNRWRNQSTVKQQDILRVG